MRFETGLPSDAEEISSLVLGLSDAFYVAPDRAGAEPFKASVSVDAVRGYLQASNFSYLIARAAEGTLAGFIAIRDGTHLFHLFVAEAFQGDGLARRLWDQARSTADAQGTVPAFTVNASLNAVPVYERFGFEKQGEIQIAHGVRFQPMRRVGLVQALGRGRGRQDQNAPITQEERSSPIPGIYRAFAGFPQPSRYIIDDLYEPERLDYEEMLGGKPREAIEAVDFGMVSWGPLGFLTPEAAAYLLPRLMELAEVGSRNASGDLFLMRFINYISLGPSTSEFSLLGCQQRTAVAEYLHHVASHHMEAVQLECWDESLRAAMQLWSSG